jgi:hypothetical protein
MFRFGCDNFANVWSISLSRYRLQDTAITFAIASIRSSGIAFSQSRLRSRSRLGGAQTRKVRRQSIDDAFGSAAD